MVLRTRLTSLSLESLVGRRWRSRFATPEALADSLVAGDRGALAEAITLVESRLPAKRSRGDALLSLLLARARHRREEMGPSSLTFRVGLTGAPGVGKSSLIEALGSHVMSEGRRVAVLTVDPSSKRTGGSILGDMSRMPKLSVCPGAFVRSSPTHGSLGGVTRGTQEAIVLCEAAGYDLVIIETVGVGQSEVEVADMVDLFCLLISPTHGDELQGVKRGVMEACELVVVTKADGDLLPSARSTQAEHISALKFFRPKSPNWNTPVLRVSANTGEGLSSLWDGETGMLGFWRVMLGSGELEARRERQLKAWMQRHLETELLRQLRSNPWVSSTWAHMEREVREGRMTPGKAAEITLQHFLLNPNEEKGFRKY